MFRLRLSLAFGLLVALVCVQAGFVYWGANRVNDYAQHSRLASDIQSELLELSANKQRLRVWASQRLMNADASPEVRDRLLTRMQISAATLKQLAARDITLWNEISARDGVPIPPEVEQLASMAELLGDNIAAVQTRLLGLVPLQRDADFAGVWRELNQVFDMARGRDLRELINGAIERQRRAVPIARAATERGLDRVRTQAITMAGLTLLAAIVLALHLGRRLQRPLDRLLDGVRALRAGALDHRVPLGSGDEFDRVAEGFNAMAAELQQHRADADAARRRLEDAVQARTSELRSAHDTLQRIDQRRRQLFADLGHELRTPTTAIRGEAEIALRGADKPAHEYRLALQRIVDDTKHLTGRINDLLLIAKAEADQLVMQSHPVNLPALLHDAADFAEALGAEHDVTVQLALPEQADALTLQADADRLRQAIVIVLDNAIRYSPRGSTVRMQCNVQADTVHIDIQDEGIGIDADELPQVFERFVRGRRARAHRADGTGIGLSIARAIIQAHHGDITLESAPEQGTRVCIELPRHATHAAVANAEPHHEHPGH
ncbi:ATP-binding protein (plasmid) [Ralstonia sp. 25C]|uniref:sensor histidine kinase n=1 Tax=Ralstonia sp. 25C TaxID=3447363 RepID=UPI003F74DC34